MAPILVSEWRNGLHVNRLCFEAVPLGSRHVKNQIQRLESNLFHAIISVSRQHRTCLAILPASDRTVLDPARALDHRGDGNELRRQRAKALSNLLPSLSSKPAQLGRAGSPALVGLFHYCLCLLTVAPDRRLLYGDQSTWGIGHVKGRRTPPAGSRGR